MTTIFYALVVATLFGDYVRSETASFYGASYISVPLLEAKNITDIEFKIFTKRSDALLLFAAGDTDYCLIKLTSGRLKVHINLGSGESVVSSPHGLRLDDLNWHSVTFSRRDADVTLTIDNLHVAREKLPGKFFTLNINYGLFIGGQGEFSELFFGHGDWLRGCLSDVIYNGVMPLSLARKRVDLAKALEISWTCAAEFRATPSTEISFVDDGSFMSLPISIPRTGDRWELEIKTVSTGGVIFYTTGGGENSDFVGVELIGGKLHLILDKGGGPAEVTSDVNISDGVWHQITIIFNPIQAQLIVDNKSSKQKLTLSANKYFDLGVVVYVGGIALNRRARAIGQGLKNADSSLRGCIKNIKVSSQDVGFPQAKITQGLLAGCIWAYPCNSNPCKPGVTCVPRGVSSFLCLCGDDDSECKGDVHNSFTVYSKTLQLELLELSPLLLDEGQNILITPSHINVVLDYAKYGIRDSGVLFSIVPSQMPKHGRVAVEVWEKAGSLQTFTLLDLIRDKVRYVHDGLESTSDSITIDLELSPGSNYVLPNYLQGQHRFKLYINITAVNDPPSLTIAPSKILRIAQGTRKLLPPTVLNASDPDSPRSRLIYTVVNDIKGRIEHLSRPKIPLKTFSQALIDEHRVFYFYGGPPDANQRISLQVSDGQATSQVATLNVAVIPLEIDLNNNTGVILPHHTSAVITTHNLSLSSNADDPTLEFWFKLKEDCEFGVIELNSHGEGNETWRTVDRFSSNDLMLGLVRYTHTSGRPNQDNFKFSITVNEVTLSTVYEFHITFIKLKIERQNVTPVVLNGEKDGGLTVSAMFYYTTPISVEQSSILFTLKKLPQFGNLYFENNRRLIINDVFSQDDVKLMKIKYRMLRTSYVELIDKFEYEVSVLHCLDKPLHSVSFNYRPAPNLHFQLQSILNPLKVMEGGTTPIHITDLNIKVDLIKSLVYEVVDGPHHGNLSLVDLIQNITQTHIVHFTPSQIKAGRLMYSHDGTESPRDSFKFMAISNAEDDFMTIGLMGVDVTLINDNAPVREVVSDFRVVEGGKRTLTTRHLKFYDADSDFNSNDLVYTVKNGSGVYSALTDLKLLQFTQGDLEQNKVVIVEKELTNNPLILTVSDGSHFTDFFLEVRPSPPYVELTNNSHLIVSQGGQAIITTSNLCSDTNIDVKLQDIRYIVATFPSHGALLLSGDTGVQEFTQGNLEAGSVIYKHLSSSLAQDRLQFKIGIQDTYTVGSLSVRVFPPAYWEPLIVSSNNTIFVEEYTSVIIKTDNILVSQPSIPPNDITFLVVSGPVHGYLEVDGSEDEKAGEYEEKGGVRAFDQATINAGNLYYVQSATNETSDNFTVDVTNGVSWLRSLVVKIIVIPSKFYLPNADLVVNEGGSVKLPDYLYVSATPYFMDKITDYKIVQQPCCGTIVMFPSNKPVVIWPSHKLKNSVIKYIHDGSETYEDSFSIIAHTKNKESEPSVIHITVQPENDMVPILINKTSITFWQGGSETITNEFLATVDIDTEPANLTYIIVSAAGGHVAYSQKKDISISQFSQEEINDGIISFIHDGGLEPFSLEFMVVDGKNKIGPFTFSTKLAVPSILLEINSGMKMFPLLKRQITPKILYCSSSDGREITYFVTKPPNLGQIIVDGKLIDVGSNFTQSDINLLKVSYHHMTPFKEQSLVDSFTFDVMADFVVPNKHNIFQIEVAVNYGGFEKLFDLSTTSLTVEEGGRVELSINETAILDFFQTTLGFSSPALELVLTVTPQNGLICDPEACNSTVFTFSKFDSSHVYYQHDHSDTMSDVFEFSLFLFPGEILLSNMSFVIDVVPINDQPFKLLTKDPRITVVQGQFAHITSGDLITEDLDTGPGEIVYEIISGPSIGAIYLYNISTNTFTQQDVNNGLVYYKHAGALQSTSFYFRVSDGKFTPVYTVFHILVSKINLNITVSKLIKLKQGTNTATLTSDMFTITTNANVMDINFNITNPPYHGKVYLGSHNVTNFSYFDIDRGDLYYKQENMSSYTDSFELSAYNILDISAVVHKLWIHVKILPLLTIGEFSVISGEQSKLDLSALDATPLAKISNSNPTYRILKKPRYGVLKKIIRSSGEFRKTREKEISKFTHEELKSGLIYFFSKHTADTVDDKFLFVLYTEVCQPALGELNFKIIKETSSTTGPSKNDEGGPSNGNELDDVQIASPNMNDDYLLGVSLVTGVIALAFLIVGFIKCGSKQSSYDESVKSDLPDPLPRPPDDLLPSSPHIAISTGQILSSHATNGISNSSVNSSEHELNSRYPYGEEDWNTFSESIVPAKGNPMLRKNQYWV